MWLEFVPFPVLIGLAILIGILAILRRRKSSLSYLFFFSLFGIYLLLVAGVTLFPMPFTPGFRQPAWLILSRVNLIPFDYHMFWGLDPIFVFLRVILANVGLTMPLGFGISFIARIKGRAIPWLALAAGVRIEATQLGFSLLLGLAYRGVDINDAMMNGLGVLCGYGGFRFFSWLVVATAQHFKINPKGLLAYVHTIASRGE
jgi:glycopeptide antibiotics resistance protein